MITYCRGGFFPAHDKKRHVCQQRNVVNKSKILGKGCVNYKKKLEYIYLRDATSLAHNKG